MGPKRAMMESTDILPSPTLPLAAGDSVMKVSGAVTEAGVAEEGRGLADTKASNSEFKPRRSAEDVLAGGGGWVTAGPEERERPSRSESRLELRAGAALGAGAGLGLVSAGSVEMRKC